MRVRVLAMLLAAIWAGPALAQAVPVQDAMIYAALRPIPCNGQANVAGGDQVIFLENMVDGPLPSPLYVTKTTFWFDGIYPFANGDLASATQASIGNIVALLDPKMSYITDQGFPFRQALWPQYLKVVGKRTLGPGEPVDGDYQPANPVRYSSGDAILIAKECMAYPGKSPRELRGDFLLVNVQYPGDLMDIAPFAGTRIASAFNALAPENGAPTSARSQFQGPAAASTKIRARLSLPCLFDPVTSIETCRNLSNVGKIAACVQSGSSSSCTSAPVELKVGLQSGYPMAPRQWLWTDWTPLAVQPGQNVLLVADFFNAGNVGNSWAYGNGFGTWAGSQPSANTLSMGGTVNSYPTATSVFDWVQFQ